VPIDEIKAVLRARMRDAGPAGIPYNELILPTDTNPREYGSRLADYMSAAADLQISGEAHEVRTVMEDGQMPVVYWALAEI
jgi:hypothetical protein